MKGDEHHAKLWKADGEDLYEVLPVCGCGDPQSIFDMAKEVLTEAAKEPGEKRSLCEVAIRGGDDMPLAWAFLAALQGSWLIEHGASIRRSWLTPLGQTVLARLMRGDYDDDEAPAIARVEGQR